MENMLGCSSFDETRCLLKGFFAFGKDNSQRGHGRDSRDNVVFAWLDKTLAINFSVENCIFVFLGGGRGERGRHRIMWKAFSLISS